MRDGLPAVYPRLWRFCVALTGARDAGEDLAQATVLRALEKQAGFVPGMHLDRWLFVMARRLWLNDLRALKVRAGTGTVAAEEVDIRDPRPDMEVNILAREVLDTLDTLPEAQRVTALLVYVEGYRYAEAAEMLEIPIGTVMSRLSTVRRTIAARLDAPAPSGAPQRRGSHR